MLWESTDAVAELDRRFGFAAADHAAAWAVRLLAEEYDLRGVRVDNVVISAHNLMLWVTTEDAGRLIMKVCRLSQAHDWLSVRSGLVAWLAEHDLPVAAPLASRSGGLQLLRDGRSIGVQPVLPGALLDAADPDQVRAAGSTLAALHTRLAAWPDAHLLEHVGPIAGGNPTSGEPNGIPATVPTELRDRLEQRLTDLPPVSRQPVHADFRGANVLYQDGKITGVVDFEEARLDAAVVDLAHAVCLLGTWFRNWEPISADAQTIFLDSYTRHRPLTEQERSWLSPLIARGMLGQGWWDEARRWLS